MEELTYVLFDDDSHNVVDAFPTFREALDAIADELAEYGPEAFADLSLEEVDGKGAGRTVASGRRLVELVSAPAARVAG